MAQVQIGGLTQSARRRRNPQHRFNLTTKAWNIQPFMIAPVLPGETMKNLVMQARIVTDPVKNGLIGWWSEWYFFYVKHRDLTIRDDMVEMVLNVNKDMSSHRSAADRRYFHGSAGINWTKFCLQRIVEEYFRDENETWNNFVDDLTGMPLCKIGVQDWTDSLLDATLMPTDSIDQTPTADIPFETLDAQYRTWQLLRAEALTNMTYEDWLGTYGVRTAKVEPHKPELLRYVREWQYPSNTIDPLTGGSSGAVSWSVSASADKDRFFKEPGWIIGVCVHRPKVYRRNQIGSGAMLMDNAFTWLPAIMSDDPYSSLVKITNGAYNDLIIDSTNSYWVDIRDLLLYGDQFTTANFAGLDDTNHAINDVELPNAALTNRDYPDEPDIGNLYLAPTGGPPYTAGAFVRLDGVCNLSILGTQIDHTPGTPNTV